MVEGLEWRKISKSCGVISNSFERVFSPVWNILTFNLIFWHGISEMTEDRGRTFSGIESSIIRSKGNDILYKFDARRLIESTSRMLRRSYLHHHIRRLLSKLLLLRASPYFVQNVFFVAIEIILRWNIAKKLHSVHAALSSHSLCLSRNHTVFMTDIKIILLTKPPSY